MKWPSCGDSSLADTQKLEVSNQESWYYADNWRPIRLSWEVIWTGCVGCEEDYEDNFPYQQELKLQRIAREYISV